ncbi:hypothetical protein GF362_02085 [Candidatus Dojkabacteria bacterium]|nr:hypothetical protein [Candidatus Dojkabacteria bacterium]
MQINVHWGNLDRSIFSSHLENILGKNVAKIKRILKRIDNRSIRLEFTLHFNPNKKKYKTTLLLSTPKSRHHITEQGYSLEEAINRSTNDLIRKVRKSKGKKITLARKRQKRSKL